MTIEQAITIALNHHQAGRVDEAEKIYHLVLAKNPGHFKALHLLGAIAIQRGFPDDAAALLQESVESNPLAAEVHSDLGMAFQLQGRIEEALASYTRALTIAPQFRVAHNNLIYALHFCPGIDAATIHREQRLWNDRFAAAFKAVFSPHRNLPDPQRRLRIGYVSPNFCAQAESFFVVPILENHNRDQFEVHCYSTGPTADAFTDLHRKHVEHWHEVFGRSDQELADQIRSDGIDILVDLTMHMAHNSLLVFARKPAPVQVTYLAYPGGTGLDAMDYRLTDRFLDPHPPSSSIAHYTEQSIWLEDGWCCYAPLCHEPAAQPRPADWDGRICFGSLNNPMKLAPSTISLWAKVLRAVAHSRLRLLCDSEHQRQDIHRIMSVHEVDPSRVDFVSRCPREKYLREYDLIDIALDPLPYNGITTTCDALWVGVPVVSLLGKTAAGRAGLSLLSRVGLSDLAASSPEEFVETAAMLARDPARLRTLRATLRQTMESSPIMNARRFVAGLESAYRQMWRQWCRRQSQ